MLMLQQTTEARTRSGALLGSLKSGQRLQDKHVNMVRLRGKKNLIKKIKEGKKINLY